MNERKGIAVAGNMLTDIVHQIDCYPEIGMLANISEVTKAVGGCAPNVAIDLAKMDDSLPVSAIGCIGADANGAFITETLQQNGICTDGVTTLPDVPTGFCNVMSLQSGERTFFHAAGANAKFSPEHIRTDALHCKMLHIGYILLLPQFDAPDAAYGTAMARFLHDTQALGIETSVDAVSSSTGDFAEKMIPALKYCDYVIINEIECTKIWSLSPRNPDGTLHIAAIREAMTRTLHAGVRKKVIVHCKEAGFCLDASGAWTEMPSLIVPPEEIKGSVGAGDAFCAGCLYSLYHGTSDEEMLRFASAAAACNLYAENAVDGMRPAKEIREKEYSPRISL